MQRNRRTGVRVSYLIFFFVLIVFFQNVYSAEEKIDPVRWKKALAIHQKAIVIDTHSDTPMAIFEEGRDLGKRSDKGEVDFVRMKEGGLGAMFFAVFVSNNRDDKHSAKDALEGIDEIYRQVQKNPSLTALAYSPADILSLHAQGKRAILIGIENGGPLEGSLRILRDYYRLGARYITLTHNKNNDICDSATADKPQWNGLSPFGKDVVKEMNRLGMLIDISHVSDKTFYDVIRESQAPVFASHSCARTVCSAPRNMTDDMLRALAKKGGVIQVNFFSAFVDQDFKNKSDAFEKDREPELKKLAETYKGNPKAHWEEYGKLFKKYGPSDPPLESLIKQIDYIVKLVGVDYVGLGSDFDGAGSFPVGLQDVTGYPKITYELLKRGYKEEDIKKILGGNFLRVFNAVIKTAEKIKAGK